METVGDSEDEPEERSAKDILHIRPALPSQARQHPRWRAPPGPTAKESEIYSYQEQVGARLGALNTIILDRLDANEPTDEAELEFAITLTMLFSARGLKAQLEKQEEAVERATKRLTKARESLDLLETQVRSAQRDVEVANKDLDHMETTSKELRNLIKSEEEQAEKARQFAAAGKTAPKDAEMAAPAGAGGASAEQVPTMTAIGALAQHQAKIAEMMKAQEVMMQNLQTMSTVITEIAQQQAPKPQAAAPAAAAPQAPTAGLDDATLRAAEAGLKAAQAQPVPTPQVHFAAPAEAARPEAPKEAEPSSGAAGAERPRAGSGSRSPRRSPSRPPPAAAEPGQGGRRSASRPRSASRARKGADPDFR